MSRLLSTVTRAARKRAQADADYRAAIAAARNGHTLEEIGQAAGLTKQGVRYLLFPDPRKERKT
jgi:hypothetical protein